MVDSDLVTHSFELAAERAGDIAAPVYERYFERCPDSKALMTLIDGPVRGRMLQEVLRLLMSEQLHAEHDYLRFETRNHVDYGATESMYVQLLGAVHDTIREVLGASWSAAYDAAWTARIETLLAEIRRATAARAAS